MERRNAPVSLSSQLKRNSEQPPKKKHKEYDGDFGTVISTGSTLLDLAISGGRIRGGGMPGGILVEIFGPSSAGKTVLLAEIAGCVQRQGGATRFDDPEARLNKQFVRMFDFKIKKEDYFVPDTVPEVFSNIREWDPPKRKGIINGSFADSLAALSTDMEMEKEDKMGSRRAKEFSEQLRKTCRIIKQRNLLVVCSNQVRVNMNAGPYGEKFVTPGGEAVGFYSSLRLRFRKPEKLKLEKTIAGKKKIRFIGIETNIEVYKSSIWKPYHSAPITILFDYGIDDIRQNLQFIKDNTINKVYTINDRKLSKELDLAIKMVEEEELEQELKDAVIDLWEEVEAKFNQNRKPKRR